MQLLSICENTLLKYERDGLVFVLGNRKRYYRSELVKQITK
jgi:hypothetical protein